MTKFGIGQAVRRVEDGRFTTGTGQYVGDVALARQCYGVANRCRAAPECAVPSPGWCAGSAIPACR